MTVEQKLRRLITMLESGRITSKQAKKQLAAIRREESRVKELVRDLTGMVNR
jgi:Asp-tRNA(Asn)/Glu-tRNA(Gln) amidotransferase B subunit